MMLVVGCVFIPVGFAHTFKNLNTADGLIHFELLPSGTRDAFFARLAADFEGIDDLGAFFTDIACTCWVLPSSKNMQAC
jgi:hypothetical protein